MFHTKLCFNIYVKERGSDTTVGKPGSRAEAWWWNFKNFHKINHINHIHVRSYLI